MFKPFNDLNTSKNNTNTSNNIPTLADLTSLKIPENWSNLKYPEILIDICSTSPIPPGKKQKKHVAFAVFFCEDSLGCPFATSRWGNGYPVLMVPPVIRRYEWYPFIGFCFISSLFMIPINYTGWWFGTFFSIYWEEFSQLTNIFRGVQTTNQSCFIIPINYRYNPHKPHKPHKPYNARPPRYLSWFITPISLWFMVRK